MNFILLDQYFWSQVCEGVVMSIINNVLSIDTVSTLFSALRILRRPHTYALAIVAWMSSPSCSPSSDNPKPYLCIYVIQCASKKCCLGINFGGKFCIYVSLLLGVEKRLLLSDAETDISVGVMSRSLSVTDGRCEVTDGSRGIAWFTMSVRVAWAWTTLHHWRQS